MQNFGMLESSDHLICTLSNFLSWKLFQYNCRKYSQTVQNYYEIMTILIFNNKALGKCTRFSQTYNDNAIGNRNLGTLLFDKEHYILFVQLKSHIEIIFQLDAGTDIKNSIDLYGQI